MVNLRREDRVCEECGSGEVEDTEHFVMRCAYVVKRFVADVPIPRQT